LNFNAILSGEIPKEKKKPRSTITVIPENGGGGPPSMFDKMLKKG
jgi:hypothetical protein